ncbi:hypothetical protein M0802_009532 [Mischocyttarus mexicanus]|nr:hypothetical protein M0802_009532 [Mischocyttarus mexicanus]
MGYQSHCRVYGDTMKRERELRRPYLGTNKTCNTTLKNKEIFSSDKNKVTKNKLVKVWWNVRRISPFSSTPWWTLTALDFFNEASFFFPTTPVGWWMVDGGWWVVQAYDKSELTDKKRNASQDEKDDDILVGVAKSFLPTRP